MKGKMHYRMLFVCAVALLGIAMAAGRPAAASDEPKAAPQHDAAPHIEAKIDDLAWMTGHWVGTVGDDKTEQICSLPQKGEMMCVFRVITKEKVDMLELITLQEVGNGVELRVRHFGLDLLDEGDDSKTPIVLQLSKNTPEEVVFSGAPTDVVKHSRLLRSGPDAMQGKIDFVSKDGKGGLIEVQWKRASY